jgi:hypothetical protein
MAITLRLTKGSPLTHQELDDNFSELQGLVDDINAATGSFLYSGSFDGSSTLTLYSEDTNYSIDLSALSGGGGGGSIDTGSFVYSGSYDSSTNTITLYSVDQDYSLDISDLVGGSTDISALNAFTGSIQTEVDSLTAATSSYLTDIDTGSFYYSSSVNLNTITFYQGDGTTESVTVDTGSGGGGDSNLVLELISNQTVGGVTSGDTFAAGDSIESVLRSILITYIEPVLSSFFIKLNGSTISTTARDVGDSFTMNTASFSATVDDPDGNFPVSASFTASGADIGTTQIYLSDTLSSTNNLGLGSTLTINRTNTAGTVTFRINTESETTADTQTITTSVPFYWRNYLATSTTSTISDNNDAQNIVDFGTVDSTLDTNKAWTATCTSANDNGDNYTYIIYPASYDDLSEVLQDGALDVLSAFTKLTPDRTIDNGNVGGSTLFRIYKSNQPGAFDAGVVLTIS